MVQKLNPLHLTTFGCYLPHTTCKGKPDRIRYLSTMLTYYLEFDFNHLISHEITHGCVRDFEAVIDKPLMELKLDQLKSLEVTN